MKAYNGHEDEHVEHLQNIGFGGLMRKVTPPHIESHFVEMGYIKRVAGGTIITKLGHKALVDWNNGN